MSLYTSILSNEIVTLIRVAMASIAGALEEEKKQLESDRINFNEVDLGNLFDLVDAGEINQAENKLWEFLELNNELNYHQILNCLEFYEYVNKKSDAYLDDHNFCREEIKEGIIHVIDKRDLRIVLEVLGGTYAE